MQITPYVDGDCTKVQRRLLQLKMIALKQEQALSYTTIYNDDMENLFFANNRRHDEERVETFLFIALTTNTSNSTSSSSQDGSTSVAPPERLDDTFIRHAEDVPDDHSLETLQIGNTTTKQDESSWKREDLDRLREEILRLKRQKVDLMD